MFGGFFAGMPRFDQNISTLSEWTAKLERRFELADIDEDSKKIHLCSLFIGQAGEDVLEDLAPGTTWEAAKIALAA